MLPRMIAPALCALVMSMLGACAAPLESTVPLSEPGEPYDQRLIGAWSRIEAREAVIFDVRPQEQGPVLDITAVTMKAGGAAKSPVYWLQATAFATRIGSEVYYNVRRQAGAGLDYTADGEQPGFMFWKIRFLDDTTVELCSLMTVTKAGDTIPEQIGRWVQGKLPDTDTDEGQYLVLDAPRETIVGLVRDLASDDHRFLCSPPYRKAMDIASD